jgi:hypothetical protein
MTRGYHGTFNAKAAYGPQVKNACARSEKTMGGTK